MKKDEMTIKEFAKLANTTPRTLKYYESMDLFHPLRIEDNGYRIYSIYQLDEIASIQLLQSNGLSLQEIKGYLENPSPYNRYDLLSMQQKIIEKQKHQLEHQEKLVRLQYDLLDNYLKHKVDTVYEETTKRTHYFYTPYTISDEESLILQTIENDCINGITISRDSKSINGVFSYPLYKETKPMDKQQYLPLSFNRLIYVYYNSHPAQYQQVIELLEDYVDRHSLTITSDYFIISIYDDKQEHHIARIEVYVRKK